MRILLVQLLAFQAIYALTTTASDGVTYVSGDIRDGTVSFEAGKGRARRAFESTSFLANKQASSQLQPSSMTLNRPFIACTAAARAKAALGSSSEDCWTWHSTLSLVAAEAFRK